MNTYLYEQTCDVCKKSECCKCIHGKNAPADIQEPMPVEEPIEEPAE